MRTTHRQNNTEKAAVQSIGPMPQCLLQPLCNEITACNGDSCFIKVQRLPKANIHLLLTGCVLAIGVIVIIRKMKGSLFRFCSRTY